MSDSPALVDAPTPPLPWRILILFWAPLAAMWLLMAAEGPLINAFIARLPEAKLNLARSGVASAVGMILESPVIMLLTAGTALARNLQAYRRLLAFMNVMAVALTALHLLIGLTGLYPFLVGRVIGAPAEIVESSRPAFLIMAPWAAAVGYRRLWQGVLIRHRQTAAIPLAMIVRILSIAAVMVAAMAFPLGLSGAEAGAIALSLGVTLSAAVAGASARALVLRPLARAGGLSTSAERGPPVAEELSWKAFLSFYVPLSLTSVIGLLVQPVMTLGISRALYPLESLAVWPVVSGLVFLLRATAVSLQETTVGMLQEWRNRERLARFAAVVAAVLGLLYAGIVASPLRTIWFRDVSGLPGDLMRFVASPALLLLPSPPLACFAAYFTGILVVRRRPAAVTAAVAVNFGLLVAGMVSLNVFVRVPGTTLAGISALAAVLGQTALLAFLTRREIARTG